MRTLTFFAFSTVLVAACADVDDGPLDLPPEDDIPGTSLEEIQQFVDDKGFADWTNEPEPRDPIPESGSPHKKVRTYFGPRLEISLNDFRGEHPVGSASVKEVYSDDGSTVTDYFVYVRHKQGPPADSYTWFRQEGQLYYEGESFCAECHRVTQGNLDGTVTPLP